MPLGNVNVGRFRRSEVFLRGFDLAPLAVRVFLLLSASLNIFRTLAGIIRAWSQCHNWALILLCEKGEAFIAEADIKKKKKVW